MLWLVCRHYSVRSCSSSAGLDIHMFMIFKEREGRIDKNTYQTATNNPGIAGKISHAKEISEYAQAQINEQQPLEDYKELLKLTLISLGNRYKTPEH